MSKTLDFIKATKTEKAELAKKNGKKNKVTVNKTLEIDLLKNILTDDEYEIVNISVNEAGENVSTKYNASKDFREYAKAAFMKSGMSADEADKAAMELKVPKQTVEAVNEAVKENMRVVTREFGGKVNLFNDGDVNASLYADEAKERISSNPKNRDKKIKVLSHSVVKIKNVTPTKYKSELN